MKKYFPLIGMAALGITPPPISASGGGHFYDGPCHVCGKPDIYAGRNFGIYLCKEHFKNSRHHIISDIKRIIERRRPQKQIFYVYWQNADWESPMQKYSFDLEEVIGVGVTQYPKRDKVWIEVEGGAIVYQFNYKSAIK